LQAVTSALIGHGMADGQQMLKMMREEEPGIDGEISVLVGAAYMHSVVT
jgi:hypothetical protein